MYIPRKIEDRIQASFGNKKVLIILGARQVGKTTLVKKMLAGKKTVFFNFDIESDKDRFIALSSLVPTEMIQTLNNPEYIVIDEAHRIPTSSRIVKGWYDAEISAKIILLGSSSADLEHQSAESLAGRNEKVYLPPLLFIESISTQDWYSPSFTSKIISEKFKTQLSELLLQRIVYGNYPEVISTSDRESFLKNLVVDYLLKDIVQLGLIRDQDTLKKLLTLIAHQAGSEVSTNELATQLAVSRSTVDRYLDLLEKTFVIFRLPSFSNNPRKEITKNQKIFFWDTGIRNALLNEFSLSRTRPDIGMLWENWVISEFAKKNLLAGQPKNLYFWRNRGGSEVDLITKEGEDVSAYEIKWSAKQAKNKAFKNAYDIEVSLIQSDNLSLFLE